MTNLFWITFSEKGYWEEAYASKAFYCPKWIGLVKVIG